MHMYPIYAYSVDNKSIFPMTMTFDKLTVLDLTFY